MSLSSASASLLHDLYSEFAVEVIKLGPSLILSVTVAPSSTISYFVWKQMLLKRPHISENTMGCTDTPGTSKLTRSSFPISCQLLKLEATHRHSTGLRKGQLSQISTATPRHASDSLLPIVVFALF